MNDLTFTVESAATQEFAAAPAVAFKLRVAAASADWEIHNVLLQCQIQIDAPRRRYAPEEQARLVDLFGAPERWSQTLRPMLWTHAQVIVPPFTGTTLVDLVVPCTFDFNVAATKYFAGLDAGEVPLLLLFSGSIFYATDAGMQVARIGWDKEARFRLPVAAWRAMMDHYYPQTAWLHLERDTFDRLYRYKLRHGLATFEHALGQLLDADQRDERASELSSPSPAAGGFAPSPAGTSS